MKTLLYLMSFFSITFFNKAAIVFLPASISSLPLVTGRADSNTRFVFLFFLFVFTLNLIRDFYFINFVISIFLLYAFIQCFSSVSFFEFKIIKSILIKVIQLFLLYSVIGFFQFLYYRHPDAFIGLYGRSGLQSHGLAIWYALLGMFVYAEKDLFGYRASITISFVFLISFLLCFYGTGIFVFSLSIFIAALVLKKFKLIAIGFLIFTMLIFFVNLVYAVVMQYNIDVLNYFSDSFELVFFENETSGVPRRLVLINNYIDLTLSDPLFFLTGSGPGTFNSRVSFLLNGDYSSFNFLPVSFHKYADLYVFPLWAKDLLEQGYQDGSMNQPFSSVISLLAEYGFVAFVFLNVLLFKFFKNLYRFHSSFSFIYYTTALISLMFLENIYEYTDIVFCFFLINQYRISKVINENSLPHAASAPSAWRNGVKSVG